METLKGRYAFNLQLFAEDREEKTEEPTPHRLREARRRGQVIKSAELNAALNLFVLTLFFTFFWWYFRDSMADLLHGYLGRLLLLGRENISFDLWLSRTLSQFMLLTVPVLLLAFTVGLFSNIVQVGFLVSTEAINPQFARINPQEGLKRIFSRRSLFELAKSLIKIILVGAVAFQYLYSQLPSFILLLGEEREAVVSSLVRALVGLALRVAAVFLFIAVIDYIYQRSEFKKSLRMSRKELKDEYKQMEGDPHVRSRQREKQRELVRRRSLARVPQATVVITNPTEIAVALRYREKIDNSPVVVAKGGGVLAARIRTIARENGIPIIEQPQLARLLFQQVEVGEEIPVDLYRAVAEVLALVFRLQKKAKRA